MLWRPYHLIVENRLRALFAAISSGSAEPVVAAFAPDHEHIFIGQHALGGRRTSLAATRKWYERLLRLLPDISFEITRIEVRGPPWNTIVLADWNETNSGTDGVRTANNGLHVIHLVWGRMSRLQIITDTFALQETLDRLARAGVVEAHAPPITDVT
jgi:ketosteroid isomerase-like protein